MRVHKSAVWTAAAAAATFCAAGIYRASAGAGRLGAQNGVPFADQRRLRNEKIALDNERAYGFKGVITGRVTLGDGKPAVGFPVMARFVMHQTGAPGEGEAITDAHGRYRIHGLSPQGFWVQAENGDLPYVPGPARVIHLEQSPNKTAANVDFRLYLGPQITVRVRDAQTNLPVSGLVVRESTSGRRAGVTNAGGELRFRARRLDTDLRLESQKISGYHVNAAPGYSFYRRLKFNSVLDLHDVEWNVKTYSDDPRMHPVVFHGVVTGPDGKPVAGAQVRMNRGGGGNDTHAVTDGAGRFALPTYRMQSSEYGNWDGRQKRGILIEAQKRGLSAFHYATPEETWTTIPVQIRHEERPSVTGQAVFPDGTPAAGVPVRYSESFADVSAYSQKSGGATDANGRFTIPNLSPDAYYQFTFGGYPQYGGNPNFGETRVPDADFANSLLRLKPGERQRDLGRVVVWLADHVVAGRLVAPGGGPSRGKLLVVVAGKHTHVSVTPDAAGRFRAEHVAGEPLMLYVYRSKDGDGFFRSSPGSSDEAARETVRAGNEAVKVVVP